VAYCTYPALDVPTFTASCLSRPHPASDPGSQSRNYAGEKWPINFAETPTSMKRKSTTRDPWFYFPSEGRRTDLGKFASVFQTEIYAIFLCAYENIRRAYKNKRILIFSDSQAALKARK
jgi:hypothetical protein